MGIFTNNKFSCAIEKCVLSLLFITYTDDSNALRIDFSLIKKGNSEEQAQSIPFADMHNSVLTRLFTTKEFSGIEG